MRSAGVHRPTWRAANALHNCLVYTYDASQSEWRFVDGADQEHAVHIAGRLSANNGDVLRTAALEGQGIVLGPTVILGEDLRAGTLVRLLPNVSSPEIAFAPSIRRAATCR